MLSYVILQTFFFRNFYDSSKGDGVGRKCFNRVTKSDGLRRERRATWNNVRPGKRKLFRTKHESKMHFWRHLAYLQGQYAVSWLFIMTVGKYTTVWGIHFHYWAFLAISELRILMIASHSEYSANIKVHSHTSFILGSLGKRYVYHLLVRWPEGSHFTLLSLSFHICEMGIMTSLTWWNGMEAHGGFLMPHLFTIIIPH